MGAVKPQLSFLKNAGLKIALFHAMSLAYRSGQIPYPLLGYAGLVYT